MKTLPWLWNILGKNLPPNHWRAAIHEETNVTASTSRIIDADGNFVQKNIISNAFKAEKILFDSGQNADNTRQGK